MHDNFTNLDLNLEQKNNFLNNLNKLDLKKDLYLINSRELINMFNFYTSSAIFDKRQLSNLKLVIDNMFNFVNNNEIDVKKNNLTSNFFNEILARLFFIDQAKLQCEERVRKTFLFYFDI